MLILTTLLILFVLLGILAFVLTTGGLVFCVVFSDVIICVLLVVWLIKRAARKNKTKKN